LILMTFGVLNVMVGIVVEKTTLAMQELRDDKLHALHREQKEAAGQLAQLLFDLDANQDDKLSRSELEAGVVNPIFRSTVKKLGLPLQFTAREFIGMLDLDGNGHLSKHEFVVGIIRLVYCSDFQRDCMHKSTIGLIHQSLEELKVDVKGIVKTLKLELDHVAQSLRKDIRAISENTKLRSISETWQKLEAPLDLAYRPAGCVVSVTETADVVEVDRQLADAVQSLHHATTSFQRHFRSTGNGSACISHHNQLRSSGSSLPKHCKAENGAGEPTRLGASDVEVRFAPPRFQESHVSLPTSETSVFDIDSACDELGVDGGFPDYIASERLSLRVVCQST